MNCNIYELFQNILSFAFSHCLLSHKNRFKLYLVYNNAYQLIFPVKDEEVTLVDNLDFNKLRKLVTDRVSLFFDSYQKNKELIIHSLVINKIFKKVLLEINKVKDKSQAVNNQILIAYDQKLVFLLKKSMVVVDVMHICDSLNLYLQSISNYTGGIYETVQNIKQMQQKLIQCDLTFNQERKFMKLPIPLFVNKPFLCNHCSSEITSISVFEKVICCVKCKCEIVSSKGRECQVKK